MGDLTHVRSILSRNPHLKWGFIIYRCIYASNTQWTAFITFLNTRVRLNLEAAAAGDLFARLDWDLQEDRALEGAGVREVRERFTQWAAQHTSQDDWLGTPRFVACVMVGEEEVEDVLAGPPAEQEYGADEEGDLVLVSREEDEGEEVVGVSYLVPRVYTLLEGGWGAIVDDGVMPR